MELYLSSYDYEDFSVPRKIVGYSLTQLDGRSVMIAELDTPVIGQKYGWGGDDITVVYLINRVDERAFYKLDRFPIDVHVGIAKGPKAIPLRTTDLWNAAWAQVYNNEQDARNHLIA